jgi:hypothetical protein
MWCVMQFLVMHEKYTLESLMNNLNGIIRKEKYENKY